MAHAEIPAALIISSNFAIALKTEWTFGSHTHCSTLGLYSDQQGRTGQNRIPVIWTWRSWHNLPLTTNSLTTIDHLKTIHFFNERNFLGVASVQTTKFFSYNAMIRDPLWGGGSTKFHYIERNDFLPFITLG